MECLKLRYAQGYEWQAEPPLWRTCDGRQRGAGDERDGARWSAGRGTHTNHLDAQYDSCMSEMDEISYWVHTKRAPCLMNYDNLIKKQHEAAQNSLISSDKSLPTDGVPSPKKKKRKLSLLDEDCEQVEKQPNLYFETSQQKHPTAPSSCKSGSFQSDIEFNIKNSYMQKKPKRVKKQKSNHTLHKRSKLVTSTPLRRSQRRTQNISNNIHLDVSFDTYNSNIINGSANQSNSKLIVKEVQGHISKKSKPPPVDTSFLKKNSLLNSKPKPENVLKEQFEDMSDVSGFTANYIRSTKLQSSTKPHRSLRSKSNRNLVKESQPNVETNAQVPNRTTMLVCVNKSVNATNNLPNTSMLNCSTDSSQNVINLVTTKCKDKHEKINKSTSLLKFIDLKISKQRESHSCEKAESKQISSNNLDISFQSKSTGNSRYPKRQRKNAEIVTWATSTPTKTVLDKRRKVNKDMADFNDSDRKENPDDAAVSKTRSGRSLTLALRQPENSLIVYSNSTEKVSTVNTLNVASQHCSPHKGRTRLKHVSGVRLTPQTKRCIASEVQRKDSLRQNSGFAACFSDSDDDSDALKQRKFFC